MISSSIEGYNGNSQKGGFNFQTWNLDGIGVKKVKIKRKVKMEVTINGGYNLQTYPNK